MVVHCRKQKYDLYIGRALHFPALQNDPRIGQGSILANPFKIGRDGTRKQVIEKYRQYAIARMTSDIKFRKAVKACKGKVLGCWCKPEACHGDVLEELAQGA